ncbi:MAG: class I SAM-dependent methyltransferase [Caulobacter sp.]|nr:class I SAM-dependent methyltransferase [Caulobacter sp.]
MNEIDDSLARSRRTIRSYEGYADRYARIRKGPDQREQAALRRVASMAGPGGRILEIGSGPGYGADFLETLGVEVRRTDAAQRFLDLQAARGRPGDRLDVITDPLDGPYDAVVAQYVLFHVPRDAIDGVLAKIARALRPGGAFLVSMREGEGETSGDYHEVCWRRDDFAARLETAGLALLWEESSTGSGEVIWNTFLARRAA